MAVVLNNSDARAGGNGSSISYSYTVSSGSDRLLLAASIAAAGTVSGVTYSGAALSATGGGTLKWYLTGPATGANTLTFTYSNGYAQPAVAASDYTGVDQTTPLGTLVNNSGTGNTTSTGSVTCPANGLVVGYGMNNQTNAAHLADPGTTSLGRGVANGSNRELYGGYRSSTGGLSWTGGTYGPPWEADAYPVNPAGGTNTYTFSISGGFTTGGTSPELRTRVLAPVTTPVTFAGNSNLLRTRLLAPTGGISLSGTSQQIKTKILTMAGGITFGGSAPLINPNAPVGDSTNNHYILRRFIGRR